MVHVQFDPELLSTLKDKVVVLTGGATGIGRSAVTQFHGMDIHIPDIITPACHTNSLQLLAVKSSLGTSVKHQLANSNLNLAQLFDF